MKYFNVQLRSAVTVSTLALAFSFNSRICAAESAHPATESPVDSKSDETASKVATLNNEGAAFYAARDYRRAVEKFIQAYATDPDANLLFNIARCYDFLGETDAAIEKYELFLNTPDVSADGSERAREAVRRLRQASKAQPTTPRPELARSSSAGSSDAHQSGTPAVAEERNWLPWVLLGSGVVAGSVGGGFYFWGAQQHAQVTNAAGYGNPQLVDAMTEANAKHLVDSGSSKKLYGGIGMGLGGALIATSVVLFLTSSSADTQAERKLAFSVDPTRDGGAVSLAGRF